jgi:hypothetical protein
MMQNIVTSTAQKNCVSPDLKTSADSGESPVAIKIFCSTQIHSPQ